MITYNQDLRIAIDAIRLGKKPPGRVLGRIELDEKLVEKLHTNVPLHAAYMLSVGIESHPVCPCCSNNKLRFISTKKGFATRCIECYRVSMSERNKLNNSKKNKQRASILNQQYSKIIEIATEEYVGSSSTVRDLETKYNIPKGRLRIHLRTNNLVHRRSKNNNFLTSVDPRLLDNQFLASCVEDKKSLETVAKDLRVSANTVRMYALRHDLKFQNSVTTAEHEMEQFISSLGVECRLHDRKTIAPLEIDVYVAEKKFGVEYHGLYWHGEQKEKHLQKQVAAELAGVDLIQFFDYEWDRNKEKAMSIISSRLGKSKYIYQARKCFVARLTRDQCNQFMDQNHLHSSCGHSIAYGLFFGETLLSCVSFAKPRFNNNYDFELIRFANVINTNVVGGFSKIIAHFTKNHTGSIITYSHRRLFKGAAYEKAGFKLLNETDPGYFWVGKNKKILKRYQTQKHKLEQLLGEGFDKKESEVVNMLRNGFERVWDCGQRVFVLHNR